MGQRKTRLLFLVFLILTVLMSGSLRLDAFVLDAFLYVCMVRCGRPAVFMRLCKLDIIEDHVPGCCCLKKNLNASRPSEHPPVKEKNVKTFGLGGIIGCKDKTSSWHLNGFPDRSNIGSSIVSGIDHPYVVHFTFTLLIAMQEHQTKHNKNIVVNN